MNEIDSLTTFLANSLGKRQERHISFASKKKTRAKFLNALYHDLEKDFGSHGLVAKLPPHILESPGFLFTASGSFGQSVGTIREVLDSPIDAFLIVTYSGLAGVYGPETFIDSRLHYVFS